MTVPFTRQLGARSGIQLNPLADNTERFVGGNANQVVALAGRFERGRIDKAFRVNSGNLYRLLGQPASATINRLNETMIHLYEAFQNGAYEAVVYRLNVAGAALSYMVCKDNASAALVWSVAATPSAPYLFAIKHLECFNEGVTAELNAKTAYATDNVTLVASKMVTVRLKEKGTGAVLYEFTGSLDPAAKDEFGGSLYLPNIVAAQTDNVEITVGSTDSVATTSAFYGKDGNGVDKFASADLVYFAENGAGYTNTDYDRAISALRYTEYDFGYLLGGGSRSTALLSKLIALGALNNKQVLWDVPGDLPPAAAITFYNQLQIDTHYSQCYWAPLVTDDPLNGGKDYIGTSSINAGKRCARNARTDANGVPPKNWVVAGKEHPLSRTGVIQKYTPTEQELDDLAKARINPVLFTRYNAGGKYVFVDSLTGAKSDGDRKLIAVADMSSQVDDWVSAYGQEVLQLPMATAVARMEAFLQSLFEALEAAKWLMPSKDLGGRAFMATVKPNAQRPSDRLDVDYWLHYDGTTRAIYQQPNLSK